MKIIIFKNARINKIGFVKSWAALFFGMLFLFSFNYSWAAPTTDTMEGYWKMDNNLSDSSGDGNTGTLMNGASYSTNVPVTTFPNSGSVVFPSLSSYVEMPNQPGVNPLEALTFSVWLRVDQTPSGVAQTIGGNYSDTYNTEGFKFSIDNTNVYFGVGNGVASFPLTDNITIGTWSHIVGVWDHANIKIYLNGVEMNSVSHTTSLSYNSTLFRLGNFLGKMDEVRLYKRALTLTEINDLSLGKHTSMIWDGSLSVDYENVENWNLGIIPDPYTLISIPNLTNEPKFSQSELLAGIKIETDSSLNILSHNLTINDSGTFDNNGSLILENLNTQVISGFVNDINSGAIIIEGDSTGATLKTGSQYYDLTMSGTGSISSQSAALNVKRNLVCNSGTFVLQGSTTVYGNILLNGGNLSASVLSPIALHGNWYTQGASLFSAGAGTVHLAGTNQSIAGSSSFYNLTKNTSTADTLTFEAGTIQTILNNLSLRGAVNNMLSLRSSATGTQWQIDPRGLKDVEYIDLKDSNNINTASINTTGIRVINSGNNTNWIFDTAAPLINLSSSVLSSSNPRHSIAGVATDAGIVSAVYFSLDSDTWLPCVADDGVFDEVEESFICTPASDLSDGSYTMYIKGIDVREGTALSSNYVSATFAIDTILPLVASISAIPSTTSAKINWVDEEELSALVEYGTTPNYGMSTESSTLSSSAQNYSALISNLSACTNYHFRIVSTDPASNKGYSADQTFATGGCVVATSTTVSSVDNSCDLEAPDEPEIISAEAQDSKSIILEIDEASGTVDDYEIKYGTSSDDFPWSVGDIDEDDIDSFVINELSPETTYYFKVRAENKCEKGGWSEVVSTKTDNKPILNSEIENQSTPLADKIAPVEEVSDAVDNQEDELLVASSNEQEEEKEDNRTNFEDAKESDAPITEECGASSIESIENSSGGKNLKISGFGPPNTTLKIYVYSDDPIVLSVKTDEDGTWSYVLEDELEDGEHQVYVAMSEEAGKIKAKSNPLVFVKTAQAISVVSDPSVSPMEKAKSNFLVYAVVISILAIILALLIIGWYFKSQKSEESVLGAQTQ